MYVLKVQTTAKGTRVERFERRFLDDDECKWCSLWSGRHARVAECESGWTVDGFTGLKSLWLWFFEKLDCVGG